MKRPSVTFGLLLFLTLAIASIIGGSILLSNHTHSDEFVRASVLMLTNAEGSSCSAVRIKANSGHYYVLTAAHCAGLAYPILRGPASEGSYIINAIDEDGRMEFLKVIDYDTVVDLMLLESNAKFGVSIASSLDLDQKVHTVTHGGGMPMYRTDGAVIKNNYAPPGTFGFIKTLTSAFILPGSSGGALLDSDNNLVGIATHGDEWHFFSYFATLSQIKTFLKGR